MEPSKKHPDFFSHFLVVSAGDPAGVAADILPASILYWSRHRSPEQPLLVFGNTPDLHASPWIQELPRDLQVLKTDGDHLQADLLQIGAQDSGRVDLVLCDLYGPYQGQWKRLGIQAGEPNECSAWLAWLSLQTACDWITAWGCRGLLTAPLSKGWIDRVLPASQSGFDGHTGFLAQRFQSNVCMLMHGPDFSVLPLTTHLPLMQAGTALRKVTQDPGLVANLLQICQLPTYREKSWALCALNPHAGEEGLLGQEEVEWLNDWGAALRSRLPIQLVGPLAADGLFQQTELKKYRLILGCYHDQVLIPFKSLVGQQGVNCTIGLPFLRTSPDHGTAYGIAGTGQVDSGSIEQAMAVLLEGVR
ncbi:MAG: 4-hydroxythreonine-4-phosphate dehydrogenase PdxA [Leptospiraceae bacterium]|nr:4-hydroxythreonine-4-phosphate dehydrogenase PdxA [Leptospiraceae bacterium]